METIIYHGNCYDGFGAAWAAWRLYGDRARYLPALYGDPPPEIEKNGVVFIVDFSYPREVLLDLAKKSAAIWVLDHHKTAEADLVGLDFCTFDMEQSGAMLAWKEFQPNVEPPALIRYVQDRDLWRFALPGSREVSAWLRSYPFTFEAWSGAASRLEADLNGVIQEGLAILRFQDQQVDVMCRQATLRDVGGYRVPVANATVLFSEVGEALCKAYPDAPFAAYYLDRADGKRQWGLRSRNGFDVSEVAKQFGGGGHKAAAGFTETL